MSIKKCECCGINRAKCERCGFEWLPNIENPKRCSRCRSLYWNIPKGELKRGRPLANSGIITPPPDLKEVIS